MTVSTKDGRVLDADGRVGEVYAAGARASVVGGSLDVRAGGGIGAAGAHARLGGDAR